MTRRPYHIVLLGGDGIGPEVIRATRLVLDVVAQSFGLQLTFKECAFGGVATDKTGLPLPNETLTACLAADGILLGAVGGPAWDGLPREQRPEYGLLSLRKALETFANLRPVSVSDSLVDASPLRRSFVSGTDLLVVRELTGGIYFGEPRGRTGTEAFNTLRYREDEIERIAHVAFDWARGRRKAVVSVDKSNVMETSVLWRETVTRIHQETYPDVSLEHMYVDNAAMQIVSNPRQFDVILTGNMFGDILSDLAATLTGSLGVLPSACVGGRVGLFEPVHGSAPDIAQTDQANPLATILSAAMLFEHLQEPAVSMSIRRAVESALADGLRTPDLVQSGERTVGTTEMAEAVATRISEDSAS